MKDSLKLCREALESGDNEYAVLLAEEHLKTHPECAEAKLLLAQGLEWHGEVDDAERLLTELCGSRECTPDSLFQLAEHLRLHDKPAQAAATLQTILDRYELSAEQRTKVSGIIERNLRVASLRAQRKAERVQTK